MSGRVKSASHARAPTSSLYGLISVSSFDVGQSSAERRVSGASGDLTGSMRLKRVRIGSINSLCEIEIVRAERSRSISIPRTHLTSPTRTSHRPHSLTPLVPSQNLSQRSRLPIILWRRHPPSPRNSSRRRRGSSSRQLISHSGCVSSAPCSTSYRPVLIH
jgi:hypothetical protein